MPDAVALADQGHKGQVLIIDDERQTRSAYAKVLQRAGFHVTCADSGLAVAPLLDGNAFDFVLTDIAMAGMDGIEVLRLVRERDPDLPVVLMTGSDAVEPAAEAVEHGAARYLLKPIHPDVLRQAAKDAVRLRAAARIKRRAYALFAEAAQEEARSSAELDAALHVIEMSYQPIVRWSDRSVVAYEALLRSRRPSLGSAAHLLAAAEHLNRVHELGRAIRRSIAATIAPASSALLAFVNVHPRDLLDDDLFAESAPLSQVAARVVLEITERATLSDVADVQDRLRSLRRLGFRLAVDDLGAGYAGLSTFAEVRPDVVKLDMSLVRGIECDPTKRKLVANLTALCRDLDVEVVAEGVERREERDTLIGVGCDLLQGFLFAKPAPEFPAVSWDGAGTT